MNEVTELKAPCKWCSTPTPMTHTKMCNGCWELERRMEREPELACRILNKILCNTQHTPMPQGQIKMYHSVNWGDSYSPRASGDAHTAGLTVEGWTNRIECYGQSEVDADQLRDFVMAAISEYRSKHGQDQG